MAKKADRDKADPEDSCPGKLPGKFAGEADVLCDLKRAGFF